jgi:nitrogen fixation-related uncharacterized protein
MNEKTLYLVVTASVLLFLGAIVFFLIQDSSGDFTGNSEAQETQAECSYLRDTFYTAADGDNENRAEEILAEAEEKECSWSDSVGSASSQTSNTDDSDETSSEDSTSTPESSTTDWTVTPNGAPCQWLTGGC